MSHDVTQAYPLEAPSPRATATLRWTDAEGAHEVAITRPVIVGSAAEAGVCVRDRTVSRAHASLELRTDGLWVIDLSSRNGIAINDVKIERARLPDGARLRLGGVEIRVAYGADLAPPEVWPRGRYGELLGRTAVMREVFANIDRFAPTKLPVLVTGETGTGKELVARALHDASPVREGPFVVVDCGALPGSLLDAELFGYVRGAFTGADTDRPGAFETAHGGTVFLDEIGELPLDLQPKLLRVLEASAVRRIGDRAYRQVDVRIVAATHRDLRAMVAARTFRDDLFFRLAVLLLTLPALRDRRGDIPMLLDSFLLPRTSAELDPAVLASIVEHPWPGNVRELRNYAARIRTLGFDHASGLLGESSHPGAGPGVGEPARALEGEPFKAFRERWIEEGERAYVTNALAAAGGNIAAAARAAGVDRTYMFRLVKKLGLG